MTEYSQFNDMESVKKRIINTKSYHSLVLQGNNYKSGCMTWDNEGGNDYGSDKFFDIPYPFSS